jgi:endonuclease YncB( thermonuclease family)
VHDGDTLVLEDGRRVRLIGVNAPEVSSRGPGDPFADEATRAAQNFLAGSPSVLLLPGAEALDRYGRLLAHVFRPADGASLASELIARGLAWQIAVPPNLAYLECNRAAEHQARVAARGVWSSQYLKTNYASRLQPGFRVLNARIERVVYKKSWWLETDGGFVLRIQPLDQHLFERSAVANWPGARVEVRGWMVNRADSDSVRRGHQPWVMMLRHPVALRILP